MQPIIDIILESFKGMILMWSGTLLDVPDGWAICDGTQGTPDLNALFIRAAGVDVIPNTTGGSVTHDHSGDNTHEHVLESGKLVAAGTGYRPRTEPPAFVGRTGITLTAPAYWALVFIMKL